MSVMHVFVGVKNYFRWLGGALLGCHGTLYLVVLWYDGPFNYTCKPCRGNLEGDMQYDHDIKHHWTCTLLIIC